MCCSDTVIEEANGRKLRALALSDSIEQALRRVS